ncbi:MAG TPA: helix-turn-helix transcriptional regulator [Dongiaceae bacterium]|nr:helix-turn-helix transcriptional regulator [Dongiaceae bacterium]
MLKHADVWRAIDRLAAKHGLSASGLARRAGLDPTSFNKSKRATREGKPRWPTTESIAKILTATGENMANFVALMSGRGSGPARRLPLIGYAQAGAAGYFDDAGYPVGRGWEDIDFPDLRDPAAYALEITGDSMTPVYRNGDVIVVSPGADIRRGDRVVVKTRKGEVMAKQLLRQTAQKIELGSLNPRHPARTIDASEVRWMARILWVSQ